MGAKRQRDEAVQPGDVAPEGGEAGRRRDQNRLSAFPNGLPEQVGQQIREPLPTVPHHLRPVFLMRQQKQPAPAGGLVPRL